MRDYIFDIVRTSKVEKFINDGVLNSEHYFQYVVQDAETILLHICNCRFLVKTPDGVFRCKKLNNFKVSKDNTPHQ